MSEVSIESVASCPTLPSLPAVAMQVLELTRDVEVDLAEIAKCVQNDQALTGKILRTINSSFYGLSEPCPTISRAIAYLGLNTVKSLVLSFSLVDTLENEPQDGFDYQYYWRRTLYGATAARLFAEETRTWDPEETFIAALLQDVGVIAMVQSLGEDYLTSLRRSAQDHERLREFEREQFGFDHAEVGAKLAEKWRLPDELRIPIRFHHHPHRTQPPFDRVVRLTSVGLHAAELLSVRDNARHLVRLRHQAHEWFGMSDAAVDGLMERVAAGASEISSLFKIDTGAMPNALAIVAQANEALVQHQISVQQETSRLRACNEALQRESITDALTGAYNRRHFDATLNREFTRAKENRSMLAIAFCDVDRFKPVNDTYGHQVGDEILIEVARRFEKALGDAGMVFRYGGEEFAMLLPGADRRTAGRVGEALRNVIEQQPFDLKHTDCKIPELPLTVSVGVAALDDYTRSHFATPEHLLQHADKAVYAAKDSGRNCVRVFAQRSAAAAQAGSRPAADQLHSKSSAAQQLPPSDAERSQDVPDLAGIRLLLVDDDPLSRRLVEESLKNLDHVTIVAVSSAESALRKFEELADTDQRFNFVLTDHCLPGMSGAELTEAIKSNEGWRRCPVVVISASKDPEVVRAVIKAGANAMLPKDALALDPRNSLRLLVEQWRPFSLAA